MMWNAGGVVVTQGCPKVGGKPLPGARGEGSVFESCCQRLGLRQSLGPPGGVAHPAPSRNEVGLGGVASQMR